MTATVTVPVDHDMAAIAMLAGGTVNHTKTASKADRTVRLYVDGCTQADLDAAVAQYDHLVTVRARAVAVIKDTAARTIIARLPAWRQRNLSARASELLAKRFDGDALTPTETAEQTAIKETWAWVTAVRAASDRVETAIAKAQNADEVAAAVAAATWPEYPDGDA